MRGGILFHFFKKNRKLIHLSKIFTLFVGKIFFLLQDGFGEKRCGIFAKLY